MKKYILAFAIAAMLSGCSLFPKKPVAYVQPDIVEIDSKVFQSCSKLIKATENSFEHILEITIKNDALYLECANKLEVSNKLLRQFSNTKEK